MHDYKTTLQLLNIHSYSALKTITIFFDGLCFIDYMKTMTLKLVFNI